MPSTSSGFGGGGGGYKSIFSPTYESSFNEFSNFSPQLPGIERMTTPPVRKKAGEVGENSRLGWVLMVFSRLSQAERPHEDMTSLSTCMALFDYLAKVKDPLTRAGRILLRLSK